MPETETTPATETKPAEAEQSTETPAEKPAETPEPGKEGEPSGEPEKPAMTLDQAMAEVTKTRSEAANYRTKARDAEKKLSEAKSLDEVNEIVATMTSEREAAERVLLVENVALKHGLPEALAARLQGTTREELEADAKALAALVPAAEVEGNTPTPRLKGGLTPSEITDEDEGLTPGELARKYNPGRRSRA